MEEINELRKSFLIDTENDGEVKKSRNKYAVIAAVNVSTLQQFSGIQVIVLYAGDIMLRIWPSIEKTLPILLHSLGFVATLQTIWLIERFGRK